MLSSSKTVRWKSTYFFGFYIWKNPNHTGQHREKRGPDVTASHVLAFQNGEDWTNSSRGYNLGPSPSPQSPWWTCLSPHRLCAMCIRLYTLPSPKWKLPEPALLRHSIFSSNTHLRAPTSQPAESLWLLLLFQLTYVLPSHHMDSSLVMPVTSTHGVHSINVNLLFKQLLHKSQIIAFSGVLKASLNWQHWKKEGEHDPEEQRRPQSSVTFQVTASYSEKLELQPWDFPARLLRTRHICLNIFQSQNTTIPSSPHTASVFVFIPSKCPWPQTKRCSRRSPWSWTTCYQLSRSESHSGATSQGTLFVRR